VYAGIFKRQKIIPKYEKLICTRQILSYTSIYRHMTIYEGICRDIRVSGFQMHRHGGTARAGPWHWHGRRTRTHWQPAGASWPGSESRGQPEARRRANGYYCQPVSHGHCQAQAQWQRRLSLTRSCPAVHLDSWHLLYRSFIRYRSSRCRGLPISESEL
jgi:hypothetical protein